MRAAASPLQRASAPLSPRASPPAPTLALHLHVRLRLHLRLGLRLSHRHRPRSHSHTLGPLPRLRQPCVPRLHPYAPGLQSYASRLTCEKNSKISKSSARG